MISKATNRGYSPTNISTTKQRFQKKCESFCSKLNKHYPQLYKKFAEITKSNHNKSSKFDFLGQIVKLFQDNSDIISELNTLLHQDAKIPIMGIQGQYKAFYDNVRSLIEEKCPELSNIFLQIISESEKEYQKSQKSPIPTILNQAQQNLKGYPQVFQKIQEYAASIQQMEGNQINSIPQSHNIIGNKKSFHSKINRKNSSLGQQNQDTQQKNNNNNNIYYVNDKSQLFKQNNQSYQINKNQSNIYNNQYGHMIEDENLDQQYIDFNQSISQQQMQRGQQFRQSANLINNRYPTSVRNEKTFFESLPKIIGEPLFKQFVKILFLYNECIITLEEFKIMTQNLFGNFDKPDYRKMLYEFAEVRETYRRKLTIFKPLNDLDYSKVERITHSYTKRPYVYPIECRNSTELTKSIINDQLITIPQGSEHQSFLIMRKNQYEDALFKSEDEKYEFDIHLMHFRLVINTLKKIEQCDNEEICKKLAKKALNYKAIPMIYQNKQMQLNDSFNIIKQNLLSDPKLHFKVILNRIQEKYNEFQNCKELNYKKTWHTIAECNFHRSLDHRSFYFKKHDRKFITASRFEKEPDFRYKKMQKIKDLDREENKEDFETDVRKYFKCLNSFEGLTNIEKCCHQGQIKQIDYENVDDKSKMPFMIFIQENKQIAEDTFSILFHYVQNYAVANHGEKERQKNILLAVMKGLFNLNYYPIQFDENTMNESSFIKKCTQIENEIFDKIYSYFSQPNKMEENKEHRQSISNNNPTESPNQIEHEDDDMDPMCNNDKKEQDQDKSSEEEDSAPNINQNNNIKSQNQIMELQEDNDNCKSIQQQQKTVVINAPSSAPVGATTVKNKSSNRLHRESRDSMESIENILDESQEDDFEVKKMEYIPNLIRENKFLPQQDDNSLIFYGTKYLYILLRFFYTLYERIFKAFEISHTFQVNDKTKILSQENKEKLAAERYELFKNSLIFHCKNRDSIKYEDYLRSIFGSQAFLLFTMDKILSLTCKTLRNLQEDELSKRLLQQYVNLETCQQLDRCNFLSDELNFAQANQLVLDQQMQMNDINLYRFFYDEKNGVIYINQFEPQYKEWEVQKLSQVKQYFQQFTIANNCIYQNKCQKSGSQVYLSRNKKKNKCLLDLQSDKFTFLQINQISYIPRPNSSLLVSTMQNQEDFLITCNKVKRRYINLSEKTLKEFKKVIKFYNWLEKTTLILLKNSN